MSQKSVSCCKELQWVADSPGGSAQHGGDKAVQIDEKFEAVALGAGEYLAKAHSELAGKQFRWATLFACHAIEQAMLYAHLAWGEGPRAAGGGPGAHAARSAMAADIANLAQTSATAIDHLTLGYPWSITGPNPIEAARRRTGEAVRMIAELGREREYRADRARAGGNGDAAMLKHIAHIREMVLYPEPVGGIWRQRAVKETTARNLVRWGDQILEKIGIV